MKYLLITFLFSSHVFANIICSDNTGLTQVQINTKTQQVWFNQQPVIGAVFSGVSSDESFTGEILGELNSTYLTIIIRDVNGEVQMELQLYPKSEDKVFREFLTDCSLK